MELVFYALIGALGGLVRGLAGTTKALEKGEDLDIIYFTASLILSSGIGCLLGLGFSSDPRAAGLAGYIGTDILENVFEASFGRNIVLKKV